MSHLLSITLLALLSAGCEDGVLLRGDGSDGPTKPDTAAHKPDTRIHKPDIKALDTARPADKAALSDKPSPGPDKNLHKGTLLPQKLKITYYYLAREADYAAGPPNETLVDANCKAIATVSKKFYDALCIEGSGKLKDGRVINYYKSCSCAAKCAYGSRICYKVLDAKKFPWGMGASQNALVPLRSWAVDKGVIPLGTVLYAPAWDGAPIPKQDGLGGFTHDGCFRADDVGGGIKGFHYDFFAGTMALYKALSKISNGKYKTYNTFTVYRDAGRCAHLKAKKP